MITATEAARLSGRILVQEKTDIHLMCDKVLEHISNQIANEASKGKSEITFRWNYFYKSGGQSYNSIKTIGLEHVLPGLTVDPYCWDGGEGTRDSLSESGIYMKSVLESNGFRVGFQIGFMKIAW